MNIKEYLKNNLLLTDGAMGTYYSEVTGNDITYCELGNLDNKDVIRKIHLEYIEAGAKLIRTNTFSANTLTLNVSRDKLKDIITAGIDIAKEAVNGRNVYIGASIGPIRNEKLDYEENEILEEYKFIVDCIFENNINIFVFETFSNVNFLREISEYIKAKDKEAFILTQFAVKPDGYSRDGLSVTRIASYIENIKEIDAYGLNCGAGPTAAFQNIKKIQKSKKFISSLPNAGFPMIINERSVFNDSPEYFATKMVDIKSLGISIIGGCCGTRPSYIRKVASFLDEDIKITDTSENDNHTNEHNIKKVENNFYNKIKNNEFVIAVELAAPMDADVSQILEGAKIYKDSGVDIVTVPDSPMSRVRADSTIIASKIKREIGIDAMPHICCRDKNNNAIRSTILGAYIDDIRNILAVTGDPVSDISKVEIKNVFNLNSFKLINLISEINTEIFNKDNIEIGAALNLNVLNKDSEYQRMLKKIENGANFFLTQPVFDDETFEYLAKVKKETNVKILGGILPIVTYKNAMFLNNELPGVSVPEEMLNKFSIDMSREEAQEAGIQIAVKLGKKLKGICDGLYIITPFHRAGMVAEIIKRINNNWYHGYNEINYKNKGGN